MRRSPRPVKHSGSQSSINSDHEHDTDSEIHSDAKGESSGGEHADVAPSLPLDYESPSSSSDDNSRGPCLTSLQSERKSGRTPTRHLNRQRRDENSQESQQEAHQKAWYEFDLAVVLVLISPIGNWLTGGDHIRNLVFLLLLVFYLRQVIEGAFSPMYVPALSHIAFSSVDAVRKISMPKAATPIIGIH